MNNHDRCFLCDTIVVDKTIRSREELETFSMLHGLYNRLAGSVGNKKICRSCIGQLIMLFEEEENRQNGYE